MSDTKGPTSDVGDPLKPYAAIMAPDERRAFMVGSLADEWAELDSIRLHERVPADIRQQYETAKNVSLYSWFVFRFHQVAELTAFAALEWALREKAAAVDERQGSKRSSRELSLGRLLERAVAEGWVRNEGFLGLRHVALMRIRERATFRALELMKSEPGITSVAQPDPTDEEIEREMAQLNYVQALPRSIPSHRNTLAHGSPMLHPNSRATLRKVADIINQLF